ncbi:T-cell surface glycoprotein CD5 [Loxodonta africana]|uniref:T-cell surface glycoprotein CD5 n=1 Tax=Loxodonta africana TaxID=9785 RepID=UPI0030D10E55
MGSQQPPLTTLYLLGVLVTSCLGGGFIRENTEIQVKLSNSNSQCQGRLEVHQQSQWFSVCSQSWGWSYDHQVDAAGMAERLCRQLHCGKASGLAVLIFNSAGSKVLCRGRPGSFSNCTSQGASLCRPLSLICLEPPTVAPPPTSPPPITIPEPTAPPRLQLVAGPEGLSCAGIVEFYHGSLGGTISDEDQDLTQGLGDRICGDLQCGSFLKRLPEATMEAHREHNALPLQWKIQNASCAHLEQCFQKIHSREVGPALGLICSGFQPKVQSRLVGGRDICEGTVEVRQGGQWAALCDSFPDKNPARWEEVCQEQQCGSVDTYRELDAGEKASQGLICLQEKLSQCHELQEKKPRCKRVFVTCRNLPPAGLGAGTVASIILALLLLAMLLVVCGPPAYKKVVKKFRQKKQRQWIGPTGMNQNMSFHRNHTATIRSQVENPTASHVDNEYSQPPRNSHILAYPALEGALHRSSAQPDNSSDSDYDLHGAQRL